MLQLEAADMLAASIRQEAAEKTEEAAAEAAEVEAAEVEAEEAVWRTTITKVTLRAVQFSGTPIRGLLPPPLSETNIRIPVASALMPRATHATCHSLPRVTHCHVSFESPWRQTRRRRRRATRARVVGSRLRVSRLRGAR